VLKIRKGDWVVVLAGRERGKSGQVVSVIDKKKAVVSGLNLVKKCYKRNPQADEQGGIRSIEKPIDLSNLAFCKEEDKKPVKIGFKLVSGKKVRCNKATDEVIDKVS
jgi:large subunit ribosomal protein L24